MRSNDKTLIFHVPTNQDLEVAGRDLSSQIGTRCDVALSRGEIQTVASSQEDIMKIEEQAELLGLRLINVIEPF